MESKFKIPFETADIVITGMENFLDVCSGKKHAEVIQFGKGKRIQQEVARGAGKLNQTNAFMIGMQAVRFGIDGNSILGG